MAARPKMPALALDMKLSPGPGQRRPLLVVDVDQPRPDDLGPDEVLVRSEYTAFCGTDEDMSSKSGHGIPTEGHGNLNLIGHEGVGRVVAKGRNVSLKENTLVVPMVREGGGCIACRSNRADMCLDGDFKEHGIFRLSGFATPFFIAREKYLVEVPAELPPDIAVLGEVSSICGKSWMEAKVVARRYPGWGTDRPAAAVLGAGAVGLVMAMLLRQEGFDVICAARTESNPASPHRKASIIQKLGGTYVSTKQTSLADLKQRAPRGHFDLIFEATGNSQVLCDAMEHLMGPGVVLVLASITGGQERVSLASDHFNQAVVMGNSSLIGVVNACDAHFARGLDVLRWTEKTHPGLARELLTDSFGDLAETADSLFSVMERSESIRAYTRLGESSGT